MNCSIIVLTYLLIFANSHLNAQNDNLKPVTVIELFTSQGCSSCPAADRLMTELLHDSDQNETKVIGLSFHVSYWNRLGWKDPYSSEVYTERQRAYGRVMKLNTIYTPQMIVNGSNQFVGSNKSKAKDALSRADQSESLSSIVISNVKVRDDEVYFDFKLEGQILGKVLNLALVERDVENYVPRGENSGLTLKHDNVVKQFRSIKAQKLGSQSLSFNKQIDDLKKCSLVAYIQNENDFLITAGSQVAIID